MTSSSHASPIPASVVHDFYRGRIRPEVVLSYLPRKEVYIYDDHALLPESAAFALIGGQFVVNPTPTTAHQEVVGNATFALATWAREGNHRHERGRVIPGPVDLFLTPTDVIQPDIAFITRERQSIIGELFITGTPDVVIEVLCPLMEGDHTADRVVLYERHGLRELWRVDLQTRTAKIHTLANGRLELIQHATHSDTARSRLLDGFEISLDVLFDVL